MQNFTSPVKICTFVWVCQQIVLTQGKILCAIGIVFKTKLLALAASSFTVQSQAKRAAKGGESPR